MTMDASTRRAAWRGVDVANERDWVHQLTGTEVDELRRAVELVHSSGWALVELRREHVPLPTLAGVIDDWAEELDAGRGFVLVRGVPVDELGEQASAIAYVVLGVHLGVPVSQNAAGDLLGHVRDDGSDPDDPTVRRYRTRLAQPFHADGSDVVGLLCLQPAKSGGLSQIVSSVTVYKKVARRRPDLEPLLHEPWFFDRYGEERPGERPWFAMPIVSGLPDRFRFVYLRWYIDKAQSHNEVPPLTEEQSELLDLIDALAQDPALHLDMEFVPGDIQWLANRTILHSRTGYEDHADPGRRRHLLRLWLTLHRNVIDGTGSGGIPVKSASE
jgi:Taurine catabolism dioxygenase TauD, TfdA family